MNRIISFFILSSLFANSYASICETAFMPGVNPIYKEDFSLSRTINFYEASIASVKRLKMNRAYFEVSEVKSTYKRWFENFKALESHIFKGSEDLGIYKLRRPYRNIHTASSSIEEYERVLSYLQKTNLKLSNNSLDNLSVSKSIKDDLLKRSHKKDIQEMTDYIYNKRKKEYQRMGSYFDEYSYYEKNLNKLYTSVECKKNCKETVDKLKTGLRLEKSAEEIELLFNSSPHSIIMARKKEFLNESFSFVRNIVSRIDFTKSILVALEHKGIFEKSRLVKLFKSTYDRKARNLHRSMIDKISLAKLTPKQRFELLKKELVTYSDESLVVNFARSADYYSSKAWHEIKDYANKSKDLEFYNLISNSELIAKRLGRVGSYNVTRILKNIGLVVGVGAGVVYLVGSNNDTTIIEENNLPIIESNDEEVEVIEFKYESSQEADIYLYMKNVVDEISQVFK